MEVKDGIIYMVTAGEYDDYYVVGLYSTERKALKALHKVEKSTDYSDYHPTISLLAIDDVKKAETKIETWGAWRVWVATESTTAYYSAPSGVHDSNKKFKRFDVTYAGWEEGYWLDRDKEPVFKDSLVIVMGETKQKAVDKATQAIRSKMT